jgi:transposase
VFVGVDSHKDTLAACVVDEAGREIAAATFENSPAGHTKLLRWAQGIGDVQRVGVECSGTYGAAFGRLLVEHDVAAFEVPTKLSVRERRHLRRPGKSDPGDALAIARVTAREKALPPLGRPQLADDLAVLMDFRDELVVERTSVANRLHADLVVLCPGYSKQLRSLTTSAALDRVVRLLRGCSGLRVDVARRRVARLRQLDRQIVDMTATISDQVKASRTKLTEIPGVGALTAARILAEVGNVSRFPTPAHFASANGTAPIPASSGRTVRHRLNRGGNRRLNRALHFVALTQAHYHAPAKAYLERKRTQGKTGREAVRCLKRRLSDVVFRTLVAEALPLAAPS